MFREMRRKRQQLSQEEAEQILAGNTSGVLSLIGDEGYPYGVPMSYVFADGCLYFHCATSGHKLDAITACDKACFTVVDRDDVKPAEFTTYFKSVICFGRVHVVEDEAFKFAALRKLADRYQPSGEGREEEIAKSASHMHMLQFQIEHMTGKEAIELTRVRKG